MTHEQWSTTLSEDDIRLAGENTPVAALKKIPTYDGTDEWLRAVNSGVPLMVNQEKLSPHDDFIKHFRQKLKAENPKVPNSVIEYLIQHGAQAGFGWHGLNYIVQFAQEDLEMKFDMTRQDSNTPDDITYEITSDNEALLLTVTLKNMDAFHHYELNLDVYTKLKISDNKSITSKTTFKISENEKGKAEYSCLLHQDNLLHHRYEIYKTKTAHVAQIKLPTDKGKRQKVAKAKYNYLKQVTEYIEQHNPIVDSNFRRNIKKLCAELKKIDPSAIRPIEKRLEEYLPGFFTRLFRWLFSSKKIQATPSENITPKKTNSLSKFAKLLFRKKTKVVTQSTEPKRTLRCRFKSAAQRFGQAVKNLRAKKKPSTPPRESLSQSCRF